MNQKKISNFEMHFYTQIPMKLMNFSKMYEQNSLQIPHSAYSTCVSGPGDNVTRPTRVVY